MTQNPARYRKWEIMKLITIPSKKHSQVISSTHFLCLILFLCEISKIVPCRRLSARVCWWFPILPQQARWWSAKSQCVYIILIQFHQFHFNLFKLHLCLFLFFFFWHDTISAEEKERWKMTNDIEWNRSEKVPKKSYIYHTLSSSGFLVSFSCRNSAVWAA